MKHGHVVGGPDFALDGHVIQLQTRYFSLLNGVAKYYQLDNPIPVDRIVMDVHPVSNGNTGLPTGTPVVPDGQFTHIDFAYSGELQEIGKNGSAYFHGYIANLELYYGSVLLYQNALDSDLTNLTLANGA